MKNVLLLLADGFDAREANAFINVICWAYLEMEPSTRLSTCGLARQARDSSGLWRSVDHMLGDVDYDRFDALAIPGGSGEYGFCGDGCAERFVEVIRAFHRQGKPIASVRSGALPIAFREGIITSGNASGALDVAFLLLERLTSRAHADDVRQSMGLDD